MISVKKLVESLETKRKAIVEYSLPDLVGRSDPARQLRAEELAGGSVFIGVDQGEHGHPRTFWEVPSGTTEGKTYDCIIEFHIPIEGGLFNLTRNSWKSMRHMHTVYQSADVRVHCNCPDFYWSGMKYNLGAKGHLKGALSPKQNAGYKHEKGVVTHAPDVRDKKREHVLCKHLLSLREDMKGWVSSFMSQIRKFDNKIKVNDEVAKKLDEGKHELGKDIELMEVSDQDSKDFIDPIIHAAEPSETEREEKIDASEELIDQESEPTPEVPEVAEPEIVEPEPEVEPEAEEVIKPVDEETVKETEENKDTGAEELINIQNKTAQTEETPPEEVEDTEEDVLEKDKKKSEIPTPDELLGQ